MDRRDRKAPGWLKHDHGRMKLIVENYDPGDVCECPRGGAGDGGRLSHFATCPARQEAAWAPEIEIPARYEVCETCDGRGTHVNPSIDRRGISAREMHEDPDFADDYRRGTYDVQCNECAGRRVVLVPVDEDHPGCAIMRDRGEADYAYDAECEAERRFGC